MSGSVDLSRFFDTSELSDLTIKFSGREVKCHKVIMCAASTYFQSLCGAGSKFIEGGQKVIELKEDNDPDAVEAMLAYIYSFDYYARFETKQEDAIFHFNVLVTANKYLLPKLANNARTAFIRSSCTLDDDPEKAWAFIQHQAQYPDQGEWIDTYVESLKRRHLRYLLTNTESQETFIQDSDFQKIIEDKLDAADLGARLIRKVFITCCGGSYLELDHYQLAPWVPCQNCGRNMIINGQLCPGVNRKVLYEIEDDDDE